MSAVTRKKKTASAKPKKKSPATVEKAHVVGGANPTGMTVSLSYAGDDGDGLLCSGWH